MGATDDYQSSVGEGALTTCDNVLYQTPSMGYAATGACLDACHDVSDDLDRMDLLAVTYTQSAEEWLSEWTTEVGGLPGRTAVVGVEDTTRSAAASSFPAGEVTGQNHALKSAESPDDLTGIGITLSQHLSSWGGDDTETVLCFDSLTALLQYVSLERAYRFLHVLTWRTAAVGAHAHFHVDPDAHGERTLATLTSLFDGVVETGEGTDRRVRTR
ncbi:DUF7504 family protein [Halomarina litorea]|uniref:DUF7504 family protein n=1 Tax=Halomarina litorea TaxID=2961595 RepID=UPI0020C34136|nr:hypothetical protein [Halomarina sp. BCD28]